MKANIIAFKKAKILRPVLSITNTPLMFFLVLHSLKLIFVTLFFRFPIFGVLTEPPPKKIMLKLAEKSIFKVEHFLTAIFLKNDSRYAIVQWYEMELLIGHTHILFYFIFGRIFRIFVFFSQSCFGIVSF